MRVFWKTLCPRCHRESAVGLHHDDTSPEMKCGECLFADQEIVDLVCTKLEDEQ